MKIIKTKLQDCIIIEPKVFGDERGFFMETFNQNKFNEAIGADIKFVQDNHSRSSRGVLRGLHYQKINPQGKLVRVSQGSVFDVAVDLRSNSPTFGQWFGIELNQENKTQLWIPAGFAHGFMVLSEYADFLYKTTTFYHPASEETLLWNDSNLSIEWPQGYEILMSKKDNAAQPFDIFGEYF